MILQILLGFILGLTIFKIEYTSQLDDFMKLVVLVAAVVILGMVGLLTWIFVACFIIGAFLYKQYLEHMW